jgi:hypothetical protein
MPFTKKYFLPHPWNVYYARARCQARHRREEWAFTPESWYKCWCDSGLMDLRDRKRSGYVMVRVDRIEAWGPHNCRIISRLRQLAGVKSGQY